MHRRVESGNLDLNGIVTAAFEAIAAVFAKEEIFREIEKVWNLSQERGHGNADLSVTQQLGTPSFTKSKVFKPKDGTVIEYGE